MNRQYKVGDTALHMALWMNRWELVSALLEHEADVNTVNSKNETPLLWGAWYGAPADIVTQLISPNNINMQNEDGDSAPFGGEREKMGTGASATAARG